MLKLETPVGSPFERRERREKVKNLRQFLNEKDCKFSVSVWHYLRKGMNERKRQPYSNVQSSS